MFATASQQRRWSRNFRGVIDAFKTYYQAGVIELVLDIQNVEAGSSISLDDQPDLRNIEQSYLATGGGFWVALDAHGQVVGTIGLLVKPGRIGIMKKFFVAAPFRGADKRCASRLFDTLLDYAKACGLTTIVLDTPSRATRSHGFYRRHGFRRIEPSELPVVYDYPDRDSFLFRLDI
jgi:N-acetylglutamate synthase-like GNAT family acetyltransferase